MSSSGTSSGCWNSGFGDPTQGEDWDWMDRNSKVGLASGVIAAEVYMEKAQVVSQVRYHCLGGGVHEGEGGTCHCSLCPCPCVHRKQDTFCTGLRVILNCHHSWTQSGFYTCQHICTSSTYKPSNARSTQICKTNTNRHKWKNWEENDNSKRL